MDRTRVVVRPELATCCACGGLVPTTAATSLRGRDGVPLTAIGPDESDRQAWGATEAAAWWALAEALVDIGEGRMLPVERR